MQIFKTANLVKHLFSPIASGRWFCQLPEDAGLIFSIAERNKAWGFCARFPLPKREWKFWLVVKTTETDTAETNVRVGIDGSVVQIQREDPSVRAIVPIAAADEGRPIVLALPLQSITD